MVGVLIRLQDQIGNESFANLGCDFYRPSLARLGFTVISGQVDALRKMIFACIVQITGLQVTILRHQNAIRRGFGCTAANGRYTRRSLVHFGSYVSLCKR